MLVPYADTLVGHRWSLGVVLLIVGMVAIDGPAFLDVALAEWQIGHLAFFPILFSIAPWRQLHTVVTAVFLHADVFHLLGNCLFLWVFGRSLERLLGLKAFLILFPFLGAAGLLSHWAVYPDSEVPVIGASSAIATLMGAYLALFPVARMKMLLFVGIPFRFAVPAWVFLFYWAGLQLLSFALGRDAQDGVAYAVHLGGLAAGAIAAIVWKVSFPFAEEQLELFTQSAALHQGAMKRGRRSM